MRKTGIRPFGILFLILATLPWNILSMDVQREVVQRAQNFVGSGYCRGGVHPPCFDCSGFVGYILGPYVRDLPRTSRDMARYGVGIERGALQPGDLVFFATTSTAHAISHVALYIGQNSLIHAISDGPDRGVHITSLDSRYWKDHYHSAARVIPHEVSSNSTETVTFAKGRYTGELQGGEPDGQGVMKLNNGDVYEGYFSNGMFDGQGTYTWEDGSVYRGNFSKGMLHGIGIYISSSGLKKEGRWNNGVFITADDERSAVMTYMEKKDSPWETWEGYIRGDFETWRQQEREDFEKWKKDNTPGS